MLLHGYYYLLVTSNSVKVLGISGYHDNLYQVAKVVHALYKSSGTMKKDGIYMYSAKTF